MLPPLDYLPPVKRAAIDAFFDFPPGMSPVAVNRELVPTILERIALTKAWEERRASEN